MQKGMYIVSICTAIFVTIAVIELYISGKHTKAYRKKKHKPRISPYRIGTAGLTKDEFGHRFIIDIDAEFCH